MPNVDPDNDVILRGFDLNCCQAGIDLKNGKLHYTESFEKFLKSKQILVDVPYTPFHTAIRLIKKLSMYGSFCYCDLNHEIDYLYQASNLEESCKFFGKETYDKFIDNSNELDEYFEVTSVKVGSMPIEYRQKYFPNGSTNPNGGDMGLWSYEFKKSYRDIPYEITHMWELKKIWDFNYRFMKNSHKKKINLIMNFNKKGNNKENVFSLNSPTYDNENSYPLQCLITNDKYYDCDFTKEHLHEINDFIKEHRLLSGMLSRTNNVQEQYNNVKMLKALSNKEGKWVIGTIETLGRKESIKGKQITKEWVEGLIEKEKLRMSTPLVKPYDLDNFKYKKYVKELVTPLELRKEGETIGHCVGGYSYNLESGQSRIFHIEVDGIGSTLEIGIKEFNAYLYDLDIEGNRKKFEEEEKKPKKCFKVNQHYGRYPVKKGNQTPTNKNRGIAFKLIHFLSKQVLSDQEYKDLFKLKDINYYSPSTFEPRVVRKNIWSQHMKDRHEGVNNPKKNKYLNHINIHDGLLL
jgi:hypothetical protein